MNHSYPYPSYQAASWRPPRQPSALTQTALAALGGLGIAILLLMLAPVAYGWGYAGQIFPGVSVAGIELSGLSPDEAAVLLEQRLAYFSNGRIVFEEGDAVWIASPNAIGFFLDSHASALSAYQTGRNGNPLTDLAVQLQAWRQGIDLPPQTIYDERIAQGYLQGLADQIDRPIIEATLGINGLDVVVRSGQIGRMLDIPDALAQVKAFLPIFSDGIILLDVHETPPVILDVTQQAAIARLILSAPLTITVPEAASGDPGPWVFEPETLAGMLTIERVADSQGKARYQIGLNSEALRAFLQGIAPSFVRAPMDARFIFNDETRQLELVQPAVIGRALDIETSIQLINQQSAEGVHNIALDMEYTNPAVTNDATAETLGITQLVSEYTSYFYGSTPARIQNISVASARFHGVLVAPGATFSMADILGDVSLDSGYSEALIIYGDRTIKGVGGGVCQVSTTLFRTAFFGGFQIDERYAHAYRVGYYEQTASGGYDSNLAGLDATVFAPVVDFKFTNDSLYWLLMETYVSPDHRTLTWKFYSTSDGRTITWDTTGPEALVQPPEPLYEENPDLAQGEIKQVDYEAEGANVTVTRLVQRNGEMLHSDVIYTHYLPWRAVYQYGPGTEGIPTPEPTPTEEATPTPW